MDSLWPVETAKTQGINFCFLAFSWLGIAWVSDLHAEVFASGPCHTEQLHCIAQPLCGSAFGASHVLLLSLVSLFSEAPMHHLVVCLL